MKSFISRNRIKLTLLAMVALVLYGIFLSFKSEEVKTNVETGVAERDAQIASLSTANQVAEVRVKAAAKEVQQVKKKVADSTAVVLKQQKQIVIDSLTKKKPNEVLVADPDDPATIAGNLSNYKPDTVRLENGTPIY
jgi:hypothetical protein